MAAERKHERGAGFLERLGVFGYAHLEPVLLAALALEAVLWSRRRRKWIK
jgi:hypothetical protein